MTQRSELRREALSAKRSHPVLLILMIVLGFGMAIWQGVDAWRIKGADSWGRGLTAVGWLIFASLFVVRFVYRNDPDGYWQLVRGRKRIEEKKQSNG